jgi:hypothetical protein
MKIFAERSFMMQNIQIHMANLDDRMRYVAQPVVFQAVESGMITQPCLQLDQNDAQQLMDQLWHCGLRPSEGTGSAGSLAATERHLADMRKLALHALKVPA